MTKQQTARPFNFTVILMLFSIMMLMFTGCTATPVQPAEPPVSESAAASVGASASQEKPLSLYGASAALANKNPTVAEMLTYSIQDEYLAHGEYAYILETFGNQNPFQNIIKAEEMHIAELKVVFEKNQIPFPEDNSADYLVVPSDVKHALETGVKAEIDNIAMCEGFLARELPEDVKAVFILLRDGSVSHLAAFQKNLDK